MKNLKIVGVIIGVVVLGGLLIFISTHKFADSHVRRDGVRVKVQEAALTVDECDEKDAAHCKKTIKVNGEDQVLLFDYQDFKENGYPSTLVASINGHEFYKKINLNIETEGSLHYSIFLNFHVIDNYIVFTLTDGTTGRNTTLYAIDTEGNIILEDHDIDTDEMVIKDYTDFITYEDNTIKIYATRMVQDIVYNGENICLAPSKDIVEAYYTYTYKDGKFTKKRTETITAAKFIETKGINCSN